MAKSWPRECVFRWRRIAAIILFLGTPLIAAEKTNVGIPIERPTRNALVSFQREILPILQANCLPCHNATRAKADLVLETPQAMLKGGDSGPALVPGKPAESRLLQTAAHQLDNLVMPPADNKVNARDLTPQQLGILSLWIEQGAEADAAATAALNWRPFPTNWVSSFAVALTSEGELAAVARANRIFLYDTKTGQSAGQLSDPALEGAAQRDWVSALAFSPGGDILAAAGFREVRLWQQQPVKIQAVWPTNAEGNWVAAAFSKDRTQVAIVTAASQLELRSLADGKIVGEWPVQVAPPIRLAWSDDGNFVAVAGAGGGPRVISVTNLEKRVIEPLGEAAVALAWFDRDAPRISGDFGGDPRLSRNVSALEDALALSRSELARAGTLIAEGEAGVKTSEETLKKAREKREGHIKALAEKEKELKQQRETEAAAAKERDELTAELQRISDAADAANKALDEARAQAKAAAEEDGAAQVAAGFAERLKTNLESVLATLSESEVSEAAAKTREAVATASAEAATRLAKKSEARIKAEQARDNLATAAFAAGERKADASRAQAELPPRKKQAEERLAAAQKAVKDLQPQLDKARIALDGSTQDVALAEKSVRLASETLAEGKLTQEAAQKRIAATEAQLTETGAAASRAASVPLAASAAAPGGTASLTVDVNGLANRWNLESDLATATFTLPKETPLALGALGDHEFIAVFSNSVLRIDTARPWTLQRTIGSGDTTSPGGPFADRVNALAFSPDGQLLATGGGEPSRAGELKIWRVEDGGLVHDLDGIHSDSVMAVAFSARGDWLASGGADRFARITRLGENRPRLNLEGHTHHVLDVAWLGDGGTLATAGAEGVVKLWNAKTGERRKNVEGFGKEVTGLKAVGATNQFVAVSGAGQGRVFRSDGEKVRDLASVSAFVQTLAVARNGSLIAGASDQGILYLWELEGGKLRRTIPPK